MNRRKPTPSVVDAVTQQTSDAAELARIDGQDRLTDPRTNPAVRPHADRLRDVQHKLVLDAEHGRIRRRHRVEDRRASHAEKALEAVQAAEEASSAAKSVLALHARRNWYMRVSLVTSIALAGGSAMGLEKVADEYRHIPAGTGVISEVGLTGLATLVILARSDLAQHGSSLGGRDWRNWAMWALMIVPLAASMGANVHGGNFLGALCAGGAASFSLFSYLVGVLFADAAKDQAKKVTGDEVTDLRKIAVGDDLFSVPTAEVVPTGYHKPGDHPVVIAGPVATAPSGHSAVATSVPTLVPTAGHKTSDHVVDDHKSVATPVPTVEVATRKSMVTPPAAPGSALPTPAAKPTAKRRTRDEIRAELQAALKEHYDNGGGEPQVKPLAEQINANRRIVRELLDDMNVRPMIRKAASQ